MKILYIQLIGFKRFLLNNIDYFEMIVNNQIQIILGTNGSGKSSLLQQLTPLPPNATDFAKTGSKLITISHQDCIYNLKSVFQPSQKHSFIKDDVELNPGGTVTIQRELVKTHFNITPDIHSLMLGEESFDSMSPNRRKEWFILLCDTNYDYAIKVYAKLKERYRDTTGALKLAKKRLLSESEKTLKTDEELKLKEEVQILYDQLNFLLEYRKPVESDLDVLNFKQIELDNQLLKTSNVLLSLYKENGVVQTEDFFLERITKTNEKIITEQTLINKISQEFSKNQEKISVLEKTEQQTIESLKEKIDALKLKRLEFSKSLLFIKDDFDSRSAINSFLSIKSTLSDIFSSIPNNTDRKYSNDNLSKNRLSLNELMLKKNAVTDELSLLLQKQKHMLLHKDKPDVNCPKCNYKFSLQYNQKSLEELDVKINNLQMILENTINVQIKIHEEYILECTNYSMLYRQYVQCVNNFSILQPYWDYLSDKNIITDNPKFGVTQLGIIENDLKNQIYYTDVIKECLELESILVSLKDIGGTDLKTLVQVNIQLQSSLEDHIEALQSALSVKDKQLAELSRIKEIKTLRNKISEFMDKKYDICKQEIETIRRSIFNDTVKVMQSKLANKEHILSTAKDQKNIINSIVNNINELESEELALSILIKQLSPVDGLIAEGLFGFIKNFVNQMNSLIKKVWTYPMEIKSCELADDNSVELDYKFPIWTTNDIAPDVSKGSTGMIEMINLAFKIVALKFLNLQNAPLMSDELGRTLDDSHKSGIINLIKQMVEQHIFTQIFMISHDFSQYSAMLNVDTCVLSPDNIILPLSYNENVKLSNP